MNLVESMKTVIQKLLWGKIILSEKAILRDCYSPTAVLRMPKMPWTPLCQICNLQNNNDSCRWDRIYL